MKPFAGCKAKKNCNKLQIEKKKISNARHFRKNYKQKKVAFDSYYPNAMWMLNHQNVEKRSKMIEMLSMICEMWNSYIMVNSNRIYDSRSLKFPEFICKQNEMSIYPDNSYCLTVVCWLLNFKNRIEEGKWQFLSWHDTLYFMLNRQFGLWTPFFDVWIMLKMSISLISTVKKSKMTIIYKHSNDY